MLKSSSSSMNGEREKKKREQQNQQNLYNCEYALEFLTFKDSKKESYRESQTFTKNPSIPKIEREKIKRTKNQQHLYNCEHIVQIYQRFKNSKKSNVHLFHT